MQARREAPEEQARGRDTAGYLAANYSHIEAEVNNKALGSGERGQNDVEIDKQSEEDGFTINHGQIDKDDKGAKKHRQIDMEVDDRQPEEEE